MGKYEDLKPHFSTTTSKFDEEEDLKGDNNNKAKKVSSFSIMS